MRILFNATKVPLLCTLPGKSTSKKRMFIFLEKMLYYHPESKKSGFSGKSQNLVVDYHWLSSTFLPWPSGSLWRWHPWLNAEASPTHSHLQRLRHEETQHFTLAGEFQRGKFPKLEDQLWPATYGLFHAGIPKWMVYNQKPYYKWMIWGSPHFRKPRYGFIGKLMEIFLGIYL